MVLQNPGIWYHNDALKPNQLHANNSMQQPSRRTPCDIGPPETLLLLQPGWDPVTDISCCHSVYHCTDGKWVLCQILALCGRSHFSLHKGHQWGKLYDIITHICTLQSHCNKDHFLPNTHNTAHILAMFYLWNFHGVHNIMLQSTIIKRDCFVQIISKMLP